MTREELSKEIGRAPSTIQNGFERLKNILEKKGIIINKIGRNNYTLEYLENAEINTKNLTKYKFGKLQPLFRLEEKGNANGIMWHCLCDCGNECDISSSNLIRKRIDRCKKCSPSYKSQGELKISEILDKMKISYINEYKPFKFENNYYARYDFYVDNNYIIEFDGEQHFREVKIFKQTLQEVQEHDRIKNQWCKDNNIPLIRIPYTHLNDLCLEDLLLETTKWRVV